jgi:hypothetical protein
MNTSSLLVESSPELALSADFPVIESGVHAHDAGPDLEDHVASYGGSLLVEQLHRAQRATCAITSAAFQQRPDLFFRGQAERGVHHSIVLPAYRHVALAIEDARLRWRLWCAVNHYHADRWRRHRARATPVVSLSLDSASEARAQVGFAVDRLGFQVVELVAPAEGGAAAGSRDLDPLWAALAERGTPVLIDCRSRSAQRALVHALARADLGRRHPALRLGLLGRRLHRFTGSFTRLHPLPEGWAAATGGGLDREAFRMRLFATPYAFYGDVLFRGTLVEEKLAAARPIRLTTLPANLAQAPDLAQVA